MSVTGVEVDLTSCPGSCVSSRTQLAVQIAAERPSAVGAPLTVEAASGGGRLVPDG